ncbi:HDIG domain-containing protein [Candidatus Sumerlaeota bacterium]|nr:HDIG domain-containing protein [Candidatus Sumerlaeota bacterium]
MTDIRLLEITGPQHELMRMLEDRAPGTYQHVLNVTKLAESAAEAIGANFLLVRSGAYFHDIGKMLKPKFFSENQVTLEDKKAHSKLSPYMSTLIIKNHVKEGIELGKKHGLPPKVIDFIPQHHGTSLIRFFYVEALRRYEETETTDVVREEEFRYPGPKPQTVETAIVLLADSVEAIVTSVFTQSQVNENDLRRTVAQAISERFSDGQFDECELTMRDLFLIRESFITTLKARFHQRIAYPTAPGRKETSGRKDDTASGRQTGTLTTAAAG